jgi:hypothetical protein
MVSELANPLKSAWGSLKPFSLRKIQNLTAYW